MNVTLRLTDYSLAVCKLNNVQEADGIGGFFTLSATDREVSLVCETAYVPASALGCEKVFRAFEIMGQLDFSLTGIVSGITSALAKSKVSVFVISTFDTDWILVKEAKLERAIDALVGAGYTVVQ